MLGVVSAFDDDLGSATGGGRALLDMYHIGDVPHAPTEAPSYTTYQQNPAEDDRCHSITTGGSLQRESARWSRKAGGRVVCNKVHTGLKRGCPWQEGLAVRSTRQRVQREMPGK